MNYWLQHIRALRPETTTTTTTTDHPSPAASNTSIAERLDLDAALAQLLPDVRLCVVLAYNEGMSHGEISNSTDLPLGTVKSHISRGSARLRELLDAYGDHRVG